MQSQTSHRHKCKFHQIPCEKEATISITITRLRMLKILAKIYILEATHDPRPAHSVTPSMHLALSFPPNLLPCPAYTKEKRKIPTTTIRTAVSEHITRFGARWGIRVIPTYRAVEPRKTILTFLKMYVRTPSRERRRSTAA